MVQSIHAVLRNALQSAVREELIPRNVAKLVTVSTPKYKVNRVLTVAQARAVLKAAEDERLCALYVLALCLGLRRGELLDLRWDDITLTPCRACGGEGATTDDQPCGRCRETGIEEAKLEIVQTLQRIGGRCGSYGRRLTTLSAPSRSRTSVSQRCASTRSASRPSDTKPGRAGKITGWSSRPGWAPPWNRTTHAALDEKRAALNKLGDAFG